MNSSDESGNHEQCSPPHSSISSRNIQFFDVTGRSLVHPRSYTLQAFQKEIIQTALLNNTLISLPPGLGKLFIAAVVTLNFHRWFLNSKILILSQTRSYLTDLLSAFTDYTSISKDVYAELLNNAHLKDYSSACKKPILLTSPQKLIELMKENAFKMQSVVLLIIFESNKMMKCQEYQQVLDALSEYEYRSLIFIDPVGFNPKAIRQVVEQFNISKFEVKNCDSDDIRECTYCSKINHIVVDISKPISNMKDTFFAVLEKYSRVLKNAKIISGNVTTLTKLQILKIKEKFRKNLPLNMPQSQRDSLMNSLTMCAFLCQGLELLHNWGMRIFYEYLFDEDKDADVKTLIAKDEDLKGQMKDLNKYLEMSAKKIDTLPLSSIHPKLIRLKEAVIQRFEKCETDADDVRIIIVCPARVVVDEIERFFRNLPDYIRYHCIKTNATCLANEPEHKEIVKTFMEGVINVLVLSNLVDEVLEIEATLTISLEPYKNLVKTSDPRFFKGTPECLFIVTRGIELNKFEELLKETKNEQKTLDVTGIEIFLRESHRLFPSDFDPEFECSDITEPKRSFKNSPVQKTIHRYMKPSQDRRNSSSPPLFETINPSSLKWVTPKPRNDYLEVDNSISLFGDTFEKCETSPKIGFDPFDAINDDLVPTLPVTNKRLQKSFLVDASEDLSEELILDISKTTSGLKSVTPETKPPVLENTKKFSLWTKKSSFSSKKDERNTKVTEPKEVITLDDDEPIRPASPELGARIKTCPNSTLPVNQFVTVAEVHRNPFDDEQTKNELMKLQNETFADSLFSDSSSEDKRASQNEPMQSAIACTIDYDKIEVDETYDAKSELRESFFDDLFVDSDADADTDADADSKPTTANETKTKNVDELDHDSDIIEDSPTAKRPCKVFSSRKIESVSSSISQVSQTQNQRPKRRLYTDPFMETAPTVSRSTPKTNLWLKDDFDDVISEFSFDVAPIVNKSDSSRGAKVDATARNTLDDKPREPGLASSTNVVTVAAASTPQHDVPSRRNSNDAQNTPSCVASASNPPSERSISPVLFSARTCSRDHSRITPSYNQSSSIKFGSTLDVSENRSLRTKNTLASKRKSTAADSMFDDDDFGQYNISEIEQAAIRNNVETSKDSGFANGSKSLKEYSASTPKTKAENFRTPERSILRSNESTPDSLVLDGYSTPKNVFIGETRRDSGGGGDDDDDDVLRLRNSTPESPPRTKQPKMVTSVKDKSITFSDSSLSFGDFTTPDIPGVKGKSAVFNSDTTTSADRTNNLANASRMSTMDKLNRMNATKEDASTVKNGNSRFAFMKSTNKKNSLFVSTLKQRIENKKAGVSRSFPASTDFDIVDSDEEFAWLDSTSPPVNANSSSKKPDPSTNTTPVSRHSTPLAARNNDYELSSDSPTPERSPVLRKRTKLKRKILADQFIDDEAEVSGDDEYEDDDEYLNTSRLDTEMASFIDDDTEKATNMTNYLKSIKSPENVSRKFYLPTLSASRLKFNVCSQMDDYDQSYQNDSFCVDEGSESDAANEYAAPSLLTQMEKKLERKRKKSKNCVKPTKRTFKRIVQNFSSSPDSPQTCGITTGRKLKNNQNILSTDDEAE